MKAHTVLADQYHKKITVGTAVSLCASLCLRAFVVKKGHHQDTKNMCRKLCSTAISARIFFIKY